MAEVTLYRQASPDLTLPQAVASCRTILDGGTALLYSPSRCYLARLEGGTVWNARQQSIPLDGERSAIFEARVFTPAAELRWRNELDGSGQAVLVSQERHSPCLPDATSDEQSCLDAIEQRYLLWGQKSSSEMPEGWQRLTSARIGALDVPLSQALRGEERVQLTATEYLDEVDRYGNVAVVEERLTGFSICPSAN